jgi:hypothetical protein
LLLDSLVNMLVKAFSEEAFAELFGTAAEADSG